MTATQRPDTGPRKRPTDPTLVSLSGSRTVSYATYGPSDGTPVLLLHGTPGSRLLGEVFAEHARECGVWLLAVDRPGYGRSSPLPDRSPRTVATDVDAILEDAGVDRIGVVAFSGGSLDAYALASELDVSIEAIDVIAGAVPPSLAGDAPLMLRAMEALADRSPRTLGALLRVQTALLSYAPASAITGQYTNSESATDVSEAVAAVLKRDYLEAFTRTTRGFVAEMRRDDADWLEHLDACPSPVRLWHGTHDTNVPIEGPRSLVDRVPGAELIEFDGADHLGTLNEARESVLQHQGAGR